MLIKCLDKRYEVIQKRKAADALDLYVAKDLEDAGQKAYTVVCVKDWELARKLILVTTKKNTSIAFKDLQESFNADGKYYIVFQYAEGETLQKTLQEQERSLKERLTLMKNILEQIILLNMPLCFIYEALRKDSIVVDEALEIRFNYFFSEVDYYWQVQERDCLQRISGLVKELFQKELTEKSVRELADFSKSLSQGRVKDIWECYKKCDEICEHFTRKEAAGQIRPGRIWWKAWEAFKGKVPVIKAMLAVLLIVASGVFLLWNLKNPAVSDHGITFEQIGTLKIER